MPDLSKFSENFCDARPVENLVKIFVMPELSKFSEKFPDAGPVEI